MTGAGDRMSRRRWLAAGAALAGYALAAAPSLAKAVRTDKAGLATAQAEITGSGVAMPVDEARPADAAKAPIVVLEAIRRRGAVGNPNVEMVVYPNAGHAFHADYRASYQRAAAAAAWEKCLQFFARHLRA